MRFVVLVRADERLQMKRLPLKHANFAFPFCQPKKKLETEKTEKQIKISVRKPLANKRLDLSKVRGQDPLKSFRFLRFCLERKQFYRLIGGFNEIALYGQTLFEINNSDSEKSSGE